MELTDVTQPGHVVGDGVVAVAQVVRGVVRRVDPAGVGEQLANRHRSRRLVVGQPEVGQVTANRLVQVEFTGVDHGHGQCRDPDLGDGAEQEAGVGGHRSAGVEVGGAGTDADRAVAVEDAEDGARDAVTLNERPEQLVQPVVVDGVLGGHAMSFRSARSAGRV